MTDLERRSLDEALARAMGWQQEEPCSEACDLDGAWLTHDGILDLLPEWHASLDALLRDIEPVCRERGMRRISLEQVGGTRWVATALMVLLTGHVQREFGEGPTAATALARAFLAVLTR